MTTVRRGQLNYDGGARASVLHGESPLSSKGA